MNQQQFTEPIAMILTGTDSAPLHSDFTWSPDWVWPYEGGYTVIGKLMWINAFTASIASQVIFRKSTQCVVRPPPHPRSFLSLSWSHGVSDTMRLPQLTTVIQNLGLDVLIPGLWMTIASDRHFRFCPDCIAEGYQSVFFQIDAMVNCPVHNVEIQVICPHCASTTPPYALSKEIHDSVFHCKSCGLLLNLRFCLACIRRSELPVNIEHALTPFARWIANIKAMNLQWLNFNEWTPCDLGEEQFKRVLAFNVLRRISSSDHDELIGIKEVPVIVSPGILRDLGQRALRGRKQPLVVGCRHHIYRSIRRNIKKILGVRRRKCWLHIIQVIDELTNGGAFIPNLTICTFAQAYVLWRMKMEGDSFYARGTLRGNALKFPAASWPAEGNVDENGWAAYVLCSFHATCLSIQAWKLRVRRLADPSLFGPDPAPARELLADYWAMFRTDIFETPGVSFLSVAHEKGDGAYKIFVVAQKAALQNAENCESCA